MASPNLTNAMERTRADQERGLRILAKSTFRELKAQGYDAKEIVAFATELISQVTTDLSSQS